jgi:antagonist of KipI
MRLKIIKAGLLDTVQDGGRHGFQHLGINPGGAMDRFGARLANALLGNNPDAPVIEMHYPAPQIRFQTAAIICLTGADFTPLLDGEAVCLNQPIAVKENTLLTFEGRRHGARCYLSLLNGWQLQPWLNSFSTNLKAAVGGYGGRRLQKEDELAFAPLSFLLEKSFCLLPWKYHPPVDDTNEVGFLVGPEWDWLTTKGQTDLQNELFSITPASDRMGYRLQAEALEQEQKEQLISSAVNFGTVQLLPSGQLVVLMADHQTTGGYPRVANVISAHLPKLAQIGAGAEIRLVMTTIEEAEEKALAQQDYLHRLQNTCKLKIENWLQQHA